MSSLDVLVLLAEDQRGVDPDQVTPGVVGFLVTFFVAVAAVLLVLDMVRRVRRVNYRAQARAKIAAEQDGAGQDDPGSLADRP